MTAILGAGCATGSPPIQAGGPPKLPPAGPDDEYTLVWPKPGPAADRFIRLTLGPDGAPDCSFSVHFEFDQVEPLPQDRIALKEVAECLERPDAREHDILLVGRADARGSDGYNSQLGFQRAERVRTILVREGLDRDRIVITSRGELGAKGSDPSYAHGFDRRVDLKLEGTAHTPGARASR